MKKDLSRLYEQLTGEERFKLLMSAMARNDKEEADKLALTCPKKNYSMTDAAYVDRRDFSRVIALVFWCDLLVEERAVLSIESAIDVYKASIKTYVSAYEAGAANAWRIAKMEDELPLPFSKADELKEIPEEYTDLLEARKRSLKTYIVAFESFCEEIDIPVEHLLSWFPPVIQALNTWREKLTDVEPINELLELYLQIYRNNWNGEATQFN